jgi:hypothetical protein
MAKAAKMAKSQRKPSVAKIMAKSAKMKITKIEMAMKKKQYEAMAAAA